MHDNINKMQQNRVQELKVSSCLKQMKSLFSKPFKFLFGWFIPVPWKNFLQHDYETDQCIQVTENNRKKKTECDFLTETAISLPRLPRYLAFSPS